MNLNEIIKNSLNEPEPKAEADSAANTGDDAKAVSPSEETSDSNGGTEDGNKPVVESKESEGPQPQETKDENQTQKFSKRQQARHAWAKITSQNSKLKADMDKILTALEKVKGIKYDPKNDNIEEYLQLRDKIHDLEAQHSAMQKQLDAASPELRVAQAESVFEGNDKALADYKANVLPHLSEITEILAAKAPIVLRYLKGSEAAPLIESKLMGNDGLATLQWVNAADQQVAWRRLEQLERELLEETKAISAPVTPKKSNRSTGSVQEPDAGNGKPNNLARTKAQIMAMFGR